METEAGTPANYQVINGIPTYVRSEGTGKPVVMLHGMASSSDIWGFTIEALKSQYRVIVPDLPGHGRSGGKSGQYKLSFYTDWLAVLMDRFDVESGTLIGNSLGGAISLAYSMEHPARTKQLILSDPLGLSASLPWQAVTNTIRQLPQTVMGLIKKQVDPYLMRSLSPWIFRDPWGTAYDTIEQMAALNFQRSLWGLGAGLQVMLRDFLLPKRRLEFIERLGKIDTPTLVIWGRHDGLLPLKQAAPGLERLDPAKVAVLEDSSHSPMIEQPKEFNTLVGQFLKGTTGKSKQQSGPRKTRKKGKTTKTVLS